MAERADEGPRNPEEWLRRLTEIVPDVEKQRELKEKFCPIRETTIAELKKIKDRVSAMDKGKKCADIGSSGITFISSVLAVAGQFGSLTGFVKPDVCKSMVESGQLGSFFGRFVNLGSRIANKVVQRWNAKTVKSVLEEDAKISIALMESLICIEELKEIVEEVMSFDLFTKMVNFFKEKRIVNAEDVDADLCPQIYHFIQFSSASKPRKANIQEWMRAIYQSLSSRITFFNVMEMYRKIDIAAMTQTYDDLYFIKDKVFKMAPTESLLKTNYKFRTLKGMGNICMLSSDVVGLVNQCLLLSKKCHDIDVESEFVTKLEKCISLLQEELDIIKSLNLD